MKDKLLEAYENKLKTTTDPEEIEYIKESIQVLNRNKPKPHKDQLSFELDN